MNNSKIAYNFEDDDEYTDTKVFLEQQQGELSQIVDAINGVEASQDWRKLKRLVLDGVLVNLEHQLKVESERKEVNTPELYRLQGQIVWARKYANLKKLAEFFKQSLENIKHKLNKQQINE